MKKLIIINFLILALLLVATEMFVRYALKYNVQGISKNLINKKEKVLFNNKNLKNTTAFGARIYTDENGFRISKNQKKEKLNKIIFIGGSITFGPAILAEDTFVGLLNKVNEISVLNASVFGSNLENNYKLYKKFIKDKSIKKAFISLALDDLRSDKIFNTEKNNNNKILKDIKIINKINYYLRAKSAAYVYFKNFLLNPRKTYYLNDLAVYKNIDNLNKASSIFNNFSHEKGKIIFYIVPYAQQVTLNGCQTKDIGEIFLENNLNIKKIKYLNLKKQFCMHKNPSHLYLKYDPVHLSKTGHAFVFNILKEYIN
jgi:hypothetical protein